MKIVLFLVGFVVVCVGLFEFISKLSVWCVFGLEEHFLIYP